MFSLVDSQQRRVVEAMRDVGAVSPATALKASQLPELVREHLDYYVTLGVVREGAPGTFYLFVAPPPPAWSIRRIGLLLLFWLLVIIVPVLMLWVSNRT